MTTSFRHQQAVQEVHVFIINTIFFNYLQEKHQTLQLQLKFAR